MLRSRVRRMIGPGERAPDFVLPLRDGTPTRFYGVAGGKLTVLILWPPGELARLETELRARLEADDAIIFIVRSPTLSEPLSAPVVFLDGEDAVASMYGCASRAILFLDASLRVVARVDEERELEEALALVRATRPSPPSTAPVEIRVQAPVLLVRDALERSICSELISIFEQDGGVETGVERSYAGKRSDALDPDFKRRRDLTVNDPELMKKLSASIGRRILPEVRHAFAFEATRFEGFKIARYHAEEAGHFRAHRDNLSPATAHRRFALTLNLNDDYDGGHLRFPEYGPHLYRPSAGGAVLFSCSLLHEATMVTRGARYVLLSFLFAGER